MAKNDTKSAGRGPHMIKIYLRRFAHAAAPVINLVKIQDLALKIAAFNIEFLSLAYCHVFFGLWDPSSSIRLVRLYNIARNQLLGSSERRF